MDTLAPVILFMTGEFEGLQPLMMRLEASGARVERLRAPHELRSWNSGPPARVLILDPRLVSPDEILERPPARTILMLAPSPPSAADPREYRPPSGTWSAQIVPPTSLYDEILRAIGSATPAAAGAPKAPKRILCVDDDPRYLRSLVRDLERHGYEVLSSGSASQALETASRLHPALAIVDIMMPEMDGLELTERLAAGNGEPVPVVLLTALDSEEAVFQGFSRGARYLLHKTRESDKIMDVVDFFVGDLSEEERRVLKEKL